MLKISFGYGLEYVESLQDGISWYLFIRKFLGHCFQISAVNRFWFSCLVVLLFVVHVCSVSFVASLWCSCDNRWSEDCRMLLRIWWRCDNDFRNLLKWQIVNCIYIYLSNDAMKHYKFCRSMILLSIIRGMSLLLNLR